MMAMVRSGRTWDGPWFLDGLWLDAVFESKWNPEESFKSCLFFGLRRAQVEGPVGSLCGLPGVSENQGPEYRPQNSRALIMRTPKKRTPNLQK